MWIYRLLATLVVILCFALGVQAQTDAPTVSPAEQTRIRPLITELTKAQDTWTAKRTLLPESKAVTEARAALQKAMEAEDAAARKLPEFDPVKAAEARVLNEMYRILADHKLSSREWRPTITDKGELAIVKVQP